ncbi:hypothetical protein ILUMI_00066 [Ignelater luminosus]|uniref:Uncharacterized protein n=1 Tax=Ignelater luminosus TaxID=2038154 RepID=A0A8K0DTC2_IGNLU|nr:hypothetical protein ILUMI_00066 [Ignelater luminosus]
MKTCVLNLFTTLLIVVLMKFLDAPNRYYLPVAPPAGSQPFPIPLSRKNVEIHTIVDANPLLAALLLSSILGIEAKSPGFNHPQHLSTNPYIALLLSHYGRYIPLYGGGHGIYGYNAANNYHNNKPFGAYKIYEDRDT